MRSAQMGICLFITGSCALALGSGLAQAQQKTQPRSKEPPVFGETVEVRAVNVEAVVTDKDGNRVTGLKSSDFRLKVDGKPVPVDYFSEILGGQSVAPPPASAGEAAPADVPGMAPGSSVGTSYLVFVDDYFPIKKHRDEVLRSIKNDLSHLGPEDRMAIVAFNGGRLALLSNWSQSKAALSQAFDQAMARGTYGINRVNELDRFNRDQGFGSISTDNSSNRVQSDGISLPVSGLSPSETAYSDTIFRQVQGVVDAAARTLRTFASPPGRKVMLLLDGGWPFSIEEFIGNKNRNPTSRESKAGESLLHNLSSTANLLGYTIYPIDVPGSAAISSNASIESSIRYTLDFIAQATGGKALSNSNRIAALAQVAADTRSYYWLGFSPTWGHNDARHRVEVSVAGKPGLKVRSRENFLDLSKKSEISMRVESALLFGNIPGSIALPMRVGTPKKTLKGTVVPITLGLPADVVTLVQVGKKYAAHAELRFAASDENGNASQIPVLPLDISSDHPANPGGYIKFETKITLWGRANHLVATVYDPISDKLATAEADLKP